MACLFFICFCELDYTLSDVTRALVFQGFTRLCKTPGFAGGYLLRLCCIFCFCDGFVEILCAVCYSAHAGKGQRTRELTTTCNSHHRRAGDGCSPETNPYHKIS